MPAPKNKTKLIKSAPQQLPKCPTGIYGLDEIAKGGLPRGRSTLVCGGAGCGKTLLGMEFLVRGAIEFDEPGVCLSFEETADELASNVSSLGFDLPQLIARKKLVIDHVHLDRSLIHETGDYDLEALFVRLAYAVDSIGAKRVLLDSVEALFAGLEDQGLLRAELRRLFRWLKDRKLTTIVTGERGQAMLTRHGLEEYLSDCVILLDQQVTETVLTRRLRIIKYRGSTHGMNEYPFLIQEDGISVLPVTSTDLNYSSSTERLSTGVPALDVMFGGKGYFRGSSILISGTSGTGKSSLSSHFVAAACARGERCVIFSFEESAEQIMRNMRSIGIDLKHWMDKGLLRFHSVRPTTFGLEMHLVRIHKIIKDFKPSVVVVDPVTALLHAGTPHETRSILLRLIDFLKQEQITAILNTLTSGSNTLENTDIDISSLADAWLLLRDIESGGERNRGMYILKARGLSHSNQIREFLLTSQGVALREVYLGELGLLTGSARVTQEAKDASARIEGLQEIERKQLLLQHKRKALDSQIAVLQLELKAEEQESQQIIAQQKVKFMKWEKDAHEMAQSRFDKKGIPDSNGEKSSTRGEKN